MLTAVSQVENWPQTIDDFGRLIEATQDELIRFAFYRLGNRDDAEDVVQDVYVEAYRDRAKRRHITRVRPYLFRMVGNRCVDLLRARTRQTGDAVEKSVSVGDDAFSSVAAREEAKALSTALQSIPPKEAEVIRLRAFADLSFAEIRQSTSVAGGEDWTRGSDGWPSILLIPLRPKRGNERHSENWVCGMASPTAESGDHPAG